MQRRAGELVARVAVPRRVEAFLVVLADVSAQVLDVEGLVPSVVDGVGRRLFGCQGEGEELAGDAEDGGKVIGTDAVVQQIEEPARLGLCQGSGGRGGAAAAVAVAGWRRCRATVRGAGHIRARLARAGGAACGPRAHEM